MSLYNGPPRPGARGGRAEFSWDNVKSDKDREFYLGHSVKATTGRWQKGKDIFWYAKGKGDSGVTQEELQAVKAREREMMDEALGLKPKSAPSTRSQPALEKHEVERLLKGGGDEQDAAPAGAAAEADRIKGLGFQSGAAVAVREEVHEVLPGTLQPGSRAPGRGKLLTVEQLAALERASAGAAARDGGKGHKSKKSKKEKKEKKEKKDKHKKKHKRERSRSRSPSSSSDSGSRDRSRGRHKHSHPLPPPPQEQQLHSSHGAAGRARDGDRVPLRRGDRMQEEPVRQAEQQQRQQAVRERHWQQQQQQHSSKHAGEDSKYHSRHDRHPMGSSDRHGREARIPQDDRGRGFDRGEGSRRGRHNSRDRDGGRGWQEEQLPRGGRSGADYNSRHHSRSRSRSRGRDRRRSRSRSPAQGGGGRR